MTIPEEQEKGLFRWDLRFEIEAPSQLLFDDSERRFDYFGKWRELRIEGDYEQKVRKKSEF